MELVLEETPARERWPLAFRASIAVATGAAIAWIAADLVPAREHDAVRRATPHATGIAWTLATGALASLAVVALGARRRTIRDALGAVVLAGAGAMLANGSSDRSIPVLADGPVEAVGVVATEPRIDEDGGDTLAEHAFRQASTSFRLALVDSDEEVVVRVAGMAPLPPRGTPVRVRGWWQSVESRANPGTPERPPSAVLETASSALVLPLDDGPVTSWLRGARRQANAWLAAAMPESASDGERALVSAMTTGVRLPGLAPHAAEFRAAGMSHVLAISGFNVAVLIAGSVSVASFVGAPAAVRSAVAALTAVAFLLVTEPETSVLRAGLGAGIAAAASVRGGRARGLGTLGAVALGAMAIDIRCIRGAGFQLSYGVVVALLTVAPVVAARWQRRAMAACDAVRRTGRVTEIAEMACAASISSVCTALVAWSVSIPIALLHAGSISWLAAPLSVVTMPAAAMATIGGASAMATMGILEPVGRMAGTVAVLCVRSLAWIAHASVDAPGATTATGRVAWWWCASLLVSVLVAWAHERRPWRWSGAAIAAVIAACIVSGRLSSGATTIGEGQVVVDSLAIGRGSCTIIRSAGTVIVLDAGSSGNPDAGSRTVVPALATLGVRRVDALVVGSPSLDSCSAVPEIVRAFPVVALHVERSATESFAAARSGHGAELSRVLRDRGLGMRPVSDSDDVSIGELRVTVLIRPVGERGRRRAALLVRHRSWPEAWPAVLVRSDARIEAEHGAVVATIAGGQAARTVTGPRSRPETFAWMDDRWRSTGPAVVQRGTTTARSSTANAPASEPSGFDSSTSNASVGRSTRTSSRSRSGPRRSRSSSLPPARTTRSGAPASRAVAGRRTTATSRDGDAGAGYASTTGPSTSSGGASSAQVPACARGSGVDSRTPSMPFGEATVAFIAASGTTDRGEDCTAATIRRGTVITGVFAPVTPGSRK